MFQSSYFDSGAVASLRDFGDRLLYGEVNPLFTGQAFEGGSRSFDQLPDRVIGQVQMDQPRVETRQINQIVGDAFQTVDLDLAFGSLFRAQTLVGRDNHVRYRLTPGAGS